MRVEMGTWKQQRLDTAISISGCAISHDGMFYYLKRSEDGSTDLDASRPGHRCDDVGL